MVACKEIKINYFEMFNLVYFLKLFYKTFLNNYDRHQNNMLKYVN